MTTVSRVNTVSHSSVSAGGDWDHRLNRLLEDLQGTVVSPEQTNAQNASSEYREYRMTSSSKTNDEPVSTTEEKWVEYGTKGHPDHSLSAHSNVRALQDSAYHTASRLGGSGDKSVNFADDSFSRNFNSSSSSSMKNTSSSNVEYLTPANATTILKSGPSSPTGILSNTSPKVERKEYYTKSSYTTLIKGGGQDEVVGPIIDSNTSTSRTDRRLEDFSSSSRNALTESSFPRQPPPPGLSSSSMSESRRTFMSESSRSAMGGNVPDNAPPAIGQPLYSSTPLKSTSSYSTREENRTTLNDRSITPPPRPAEGLKTPPLVRKILQQSSTLQSTAANKSTSSAPLGRPPLSSSPGIPSYDEPPSQPIGPRFYTSTTTTEHRENRELSPVKRFPSPQPPRNDGYGEPPKRLDELLATFEDSSSYLESRHIRGDGGGPHSSHPYGPGTHHIQPATTTTTSRTVRIDESATQRRIINDDETDLHQRRNVNSNYQNPAYGGAKEPELTRNISGPPVFYPSNQIFPKTEEDAQQVAAPPLDKGKKPKKDKIKNKSGDDKGSGGVPVPVCLPVCCASPCVIM